MTILGQRIKEARISQSMSQEDLAAQTQVSQPTVANWENGSHAPRHSALTRIAHALNSSPEWLVGTESPQSAKIQEHYIPLLAWPNTQAELDTAPVQNYIKTSTKATRPIALINQDPAMQATFGVGATVIIDRADTSPQPHSVHLITTPAGLALRRFEDNGNFSDDSGSQIQAQQILGKAVLSIKGH